MTEKELIDGCIKKEAICQRILFNEYAGRLMSICKRYSPDKAEAEDILQDGFIKIFTHINQYHFKGSLEGWMRRIIVNTALKALQKKKIYFEEIPENFESAQYVDSFCYTHLNAEALLKLIAALPFGYRLVFNLNVIEGYSHEEISELLNIKPGTSRSQLVKARKMLQEQIKELEKVTVTHE